MKKHLCEGRWGKLSIKICVNRMRSASYIIKYTFLSHWNQAKIYVVQDKFQRTMETIQPRYKRKKVIVFLFGCINNIRKIIVFNKKMLKWQFSTMKECTFWITLAVTFFLFLFSLFHKFIMKNVKLCTDEWWSRRNWIDWINVVNEKDTN